MLWSLRNNYSMLQKRIPFSKMRFIWCREQKNNRLQLFCWQLVADKRRCSLTTDSDRVFIWREHRACSHAPNNIDSHPFGSSVVLVWLDMMLVGWRVPHLFRRFSHFWQLMHKYFYSARWLFKGSKRVFNLFLGTTTLPLVVQWQQRNCWRVKIFAS